MPMLTPSIKKHKWCLYPGQSFNYLIYLTGWCVFKVEHCQHQIEDSSRLQQFFCKVVVDSVPGGRGEGADSSQKNN